MDPSDARERIAAHDEYVAHLKARIAQLEKEATPRTVEIVKATPRIDRSFEREWLESPAHALEQEVEQLKARICELEKEAGIKDAYAYELAKQRDALDTKLSDALEIIAQLSTPPRFTEEMGSGRE
jgi:chromosome segregation ATPase